MEDKFALTVIIGLAIFGLFFIAGQELNINAPSENPEQITLVERSQIQAGEAQEDTRNINFGDLTVGKKRGEIQAFRNRELEISDSLTGGWKLAFDYNATEPRNGTVKFDVLGRKGSGTLNIRANGRKVFEEYMIGGSTQEVEIPQGALNTGINRIEIFAERDGIIGLFNSVEYSLEDFETTINDRKFHEHRNSFRLYDYELEEFDTSELTFNLPSGNVREEPLKVDVNGNQIHNERDVRGEVELTVTPQNANLQPGYNTIRFYTERSAKYDLENTRYSVKHIGSVNPEDIQINFNLNSSEVEYVNRDDTTTELKFDYQPLVGSSGNITAILNGVENEISPNTGRNNLEINAENLQSSNSLEFSSSSGYVMRDVEISTSRRDE